MYATTHNTYVNILQAATIIVLQVMSQFLLTKLIHLTLLIEKITGEGP